MCVFVCVCCVFVVFAVFGGLCLSLFVFFCFCLGCLLSSLVLILLGECRCVLLCFFWDASFFPFVFSVCVVCVLVVFFVLCVCCVQCMIWCVCAFVCL